MFSTKAGAELWRQRHGGAYGGKFDEDHYGLHLDEFKLDFAPETNEPPNDVVDFVVYSNEEDESKDDKKETKTNADPNVDPPTS